MFCGGRGGWAATGHRDLVGSGKRQRKTVEGQNFPGHSCNLIALDAQVMSTVQVYSVLSQTVGCPPTPPLLKRVMRMDGV